MRNWNWLKYRFLVRMRWNKNYKGEDFNMLPWTLRGGISLANVKSNRHLYFNTTEQKLHTRARRLSLTYVNTHKYVISTAGLFQTTSADAHSCMYQGVREQVRNICLSSIHTRLLITYCPASTPRWIAGRCICDVLRPRWYFIMDIVHRCEDVNQRRNNFTIQHCIFFRTCYVPVKIPFVWLLALF